MKINELFEAPDNRTEKMFDAFKKGTIKSILSQKKPGMGNIFSIEQSIKGIVKLELSHVTTEKELFDFFNKNKNEFILVDLSDLQKINPAFDLMFKNAIDGEITFKDKTIKFNKGIIFAGPNTSILSPAVQSRSVQI